MLVVEFGTLSWVHCAFNERQKRKKIKQGKITFLVFITRSVELFFNDKGFYLFPSWVYFFFTSFEATNANKPKINPERIPNNGPKMSIILRGCSGIGMLAIMASSSAWFEM